MLASERTGRWALLFSLQFLVDEVLVLGMPLYVCGDKLAARHDMKVFTLRILERGLRKCVAKSLPFRLSRHLGVSEEDVIALARVLSHAELVAGLDFESAFGLVVPNA
jgi:hypothetical protein